MTVSKPNTATKLISSWPLWLAFVAGLGFLERLLVVLVYQPVAYNDTNSYRRLAETVLQGFANYDGTRTPGYPVFLALAGTDQRVWIVQLFLGLITTLLFFFIAWKLTGKPWFGGLVALLHTLNLGQLFFESSLLTESLSTFLMVLSMTGMLVWFLYPKSRNIWLAFILGLLSSLTLLVRPLFIYLPFLLLVFVLLEPKLGPRAIQQNPQLLANAEKSSGSHRMWQVGLTTLVPTLVLVGGWVTFIHSQFNEWSLTTMTGYHLVQHTGNFFEYVPDEYASLRDTYIKYRDAHIAQFGTQTNAIWDAIPEMSKVSGYSFYGLSRVLTRISLQLILHHPILFIKSAASGWWMFWRPPVYWSADALKLPGLTGIIKLFIQLQRGFLFLINLVFIITSLLFVITEVISVIRRKPSMLLRWFSNPVLYNFTWMLLANIWIASILQTLLDHGDNPRFLVPLQSLVVLWVAVLIYQMLIHRPIRTAADARP